MRRRTLSASTSRGFICRRTSPPASPIASWKWPAVTGRSAEEGLRLRKDGQTYWASSDITPLYDEQDQLRGFAMITRDITERKAAEDALHRTAAELSRSNAELEQFAYVASHDLQEPLRDGRRLLPAARTPLPRPARRDADEFIDFAVDGASRMQTLINDLLSYSRVGTRGKPLEPTDCGAVFDQALANLKSAIAESGAEVTRGQLPTLAADRIATGQLLQNLIGNAIKFRGDEPPARPRRRPAEGDDWLFSVRTTASASTRSFAERIFVIFQRLHTPPRISGHRHRPGDLQEDRRAARRPDLGRFAARPGKHLLFHAARQGKGNCRHDVRADELGRPIEILLVEDSPTDAGLTRHAFAAGKVSNHLHVVEDGEQAIQFLRREREFAQAPRPDLILLDLNLPRKSGREVLQEIRGDSRLKSLVVVILTTSSDEQDVMCAYGLNANAYITKPVDLDQFFGFVRVIDQFWFSVVTLPPTDH